MWTLGSMIYLIKNIFWKFYEVRSERGGFQLIQILGLLGMYFDAVVVEFKTFLLLFRLALAILWLYYVWNCIFFDEYILFNIFQYAYVKLETFTTKPQLLMISFFFYFLRFYNGNWWAGRSAQIKSLGCWSLRRISLFLLPWMQYQKHW